MKKLFVLLLALAVLTGAVFGQAKLNGYVRSWATWDTEAETFSVANRLRLVPSWTSEDGNVKAEARMQVGDWTDPAKIFGVAEYAYGKIKLADGMFVVSAGRLWNFDYDISSGYSDYFATGNVANGGGYTVFDGVDGMLFQALPVEGLNIGLLLTPDTTDRNFGVGVKYDIADIGSIVLAGKAAAEFEDSNFNGSFQLTMVEGLTVSLGYKGLKTNGMYGIVYYEADALAAEVAAEMNFDDDSLYVEGYVTYTMDAIKLGASFGFDKDAITDYLSGDEYWFGGEVYYNVGKGQTIVGGQYGELSKFVVPLIVKVSF